VINDYENGIVDFYRCVQACPKKLANFINDIPMHEGLIFRMRSDFAAGKLSGLEAAAAWYIIAKTSFNAVVNDTAAYNDSPFTSPSIIADARRFEEVAQRLRGVSIRSSSYDRLLPAMIKEVPGGIFFYMDPPYDNTAGYSGVDGSGSGFGWKDQVRLSEFCEEIDKKGGTFIQTNSATSRLVELYGSYKLPDGSPRFKVEFRDVYYSVSVKVDARKATREVIITNARAQKAEQRQGRLF
jgi:DNA adenine methylase